MTSVGGQRLRISASRARPSGGGMRRSVTTRSNGCLGQPRERGLRRRVTASTTWPRSASSRRRRSAPRASSSTTRMRMPVTLPPPPRAALRQVEPRRRAPARRALELEPPARLAHQAIDDGEPESGPRARVVTNGRRTRPSVASVHARPVVGDPQRARGARRRRGPSYANRPRRRAAPRARCARG